METQEAVAKRQWLMKLMPAYVRTVTRSWRDFLRINNIDVGSQLDTDLATTFVSERPAMEYLTRLGKKHDEKYSLVTPNEYEDLLQTIQQDAKQYFNQHYDLKRALEIAQQDLLVRLESTAPYNRIDPSFWQTKVDQLDSFTLIKPYLSRSGLALFVSRFAPNTDLSNDDLLAQQRTLRSQLKHRFTANNQQQVAERIVNEALAPFNLTIGQLPFPWERQQVLQILRWLGDEVNHTYQQHLVELKANQLKTTLSNPGYASKVVAQHEKSWVNAVTHRLHFDQWCDQIKDDMVTTIKQDRPDIPVDYLQRRLQLELPGRKAVAMTLSALTQLEDAIINGWDAQQNEQEQPDKLVIDALLSQARHQLEQAVTDKITAQIHQAVLDQGLSANLQSFIYGEQNERLTSQLDEWVQTYNHEYQHELTKRVVKQPEADFIPEIIQELTQNITGLASRIHERMDQVYQERTDVLVGQTLERLQDQVTPQEFAKIQHSGRVPQFLTADADYLVNNNTDQYIAQVFPEW